MSNPQASIDKAPLLQTQYHILIAISVVHLLNDSIQSVVPAIFPILRESLSLTYTQIGLIAFALNITASILQPLIGLYSDARPKPILLPLGMGASLLGVLGLALATSFSMIVLSVILIGIGSSIFHPESSRVVYLAAGKSRGLAQSIFQVGGNFGQSLAPIMTALIFVPFGQIGIIWFTIVAGFGVVIQTFTAKWYGLQLRLRPILKRHQKRADTVNLPKKKQVTMAVSILMILVFSKMAYLVGFTSFYPFYLIEHFGLSVERAQLYIFAFLFAGVIGTFFGGPLGDRFGRRNVIWFSILGALPFAFVLPYLNLFWSLLFCVIIGITILSSSSVILVYAQELLPGRIGMVSGLFFGLAFGIGGLSAAALGVLADWTSINLVIKLCAYLPLIGLLTLFLPSDERLRAWSAEAEKD